MNTYLDLVRELKSLRKGRGVFAGRIEQRVGPTLRTTCGITGHDDPVTIRRKLAATLTELAGQLPADLRLATLAAFALTTEARLPLYQDRVYWAATRIDRDSRTVRRRVDDAIGQLAELAATPPDLPTWHTDELHVAVALGARQPEILELHRIIADRDGLRELACAPAIPLGLDLDVDLLYGGTLHHRDARFALALPRTLARGESHNFAIRFRLPTPMRPYLVHVPDHPCDLFDLRIRFDQAQKPPHVWTLCGDQTTDSDPISHPVDGAGEIHLWFRQLTPGLPYGVQWEPHC